MRFWQASRLLDANRKIAPFEVLPVVETDDFVPFFEGRKYFVHRFRRSLSLEQRQSLSHRINPSSLSFRWIDRNAIAHSFQSFDGQHRGFAAFENVYQKRDIGKLARDLRQFGL